jgi:hypothetical protein
VSTPEPSRDPKAPGPYIAYSKPDAARLQLETAILLWFNYGDPISIHTLAAAANELYHGIGSKIGAPTIIQMWKKSLSKKERDEANKAQNFAKHASTDPNSKLPLPTRHAEVLMIDSIMCHEKMFRKRTPLMTCFFARLAFENPRLMESINMGRRKQGRQDLVIEQPHKADRVQFLNRELPALIAAIAAGHGRPLHEPPP